MALNPDQWIAGRAAAVGPGASGSLSTQNRNGQAPQRIRRLRSEIVAVGSSFRGIGIHIPGSAQVFISKLQWIHPLTRTLRIAAQCKVAFSLVH
jgi:hypothetical protein